MQILLALHPPWLMRWDTTWGCLTMKTLLAAAVLSPKLMEDASWRQVLGE